tara:strand:- start:282 stop:464 length:183 start_codon:yes stop_codon:yes gene_type:complete
MNKAVQKPGKPVAMTVLNEDSHELRFVVNISNFCTARIKSHLIEFVDGGHCACLEQTPQL